MRNAVWTTPEIIRSAPCQSWQRCGKHYQYVCDANFEMRKKRRLMRGFDLPDKILGHSTRFRTGFGHFQSEPNFRLWFFFAGDDFIWRKFEFLNTLIFMRISIQWVFCMGRLKFHSSNRVFNGPMLNRFVYALFCVEKLPLKFNFE